MKKIFNKIVVFFKKRPNLFVVIALALIVYLSYGQTLKMYWWLDDWAVVYKMIFPQLAPGTSLYGSGIFGQGAYRYISTPFYFLYPLFHLKAEIYFALALLQYLIASILVYVLVSKLSNKTSWGLISAMIFSSGYFGSYGMYRLSHSYQFIETILFLILIVMSQIKYYQSEQKKYYFLTLFLFILGSELMFIRAHGMFPVVLVTAIVYGVFKYKKKILTVLFETVPFSLVFYYLYFVDTRSGVLMRDIPSGGALLKFVSYSLSQPITVFSNFIVSFENLIIPNPLINKIYMILKLAPTYSSFKFSFACGMILFTIIFYLIYKFRKEKEKISLIIFGLLWILSNFILYILYDPLHDMDSNTRYFLPSSVGTAMFYAGIFSLMKNKIVKYITLVLLCGFLIYCSRIEQDLLIKYVSTPDRQGFQLLKKEVKNINKDTLFLFDALADPRYKNNLFGNVPQMGIPPLYGESWEAKIADNVDDFIKRMVNGSASIDNFESFFNGMGGHVYTTNEVRGLLKNGGNELVLKNDDNNVFEYDLNYPSYVPSMLTIRLSGFVGAGKIKISWMTENHGIYAKDDYQEITLNANVNIYKIILPPGGRMFRKIKVEFIPNTSGAVIDTLTIKALSLDSLKKMNYQK